MSSVINSIPASGYATRRANGYRSPDYDVAIIGAGPYGLSAGLHLKAKGLGLRIFGQPMDFWANTMPQGMLLRSERPACNISDPRSAFTLGAYEAESGLKPVAPVPLETFVGYGRWFCRQVESCLEPTMVSGVNRHGGLFRLTLQNGESLLSRRVVVAAGVAMFQKTPAPFSELPPGFVSHCYEGKRISNFAGKRVAVIGGGQSALESAVLLSEAGAAPEIIMRRSSVQWLGAHGWLHRLGPISRVLYGQHGVGHAGLSRLVGYPRLLARIPLSIRDKIRRRAVRPGGSAWLRPRMCLVKVTTGCSVRSAKVIGDEIELKLDDGSLRQVDHVLVGTGYIVDISKYEFLSPELLSAIARLDGYPDLTTGFESSVPGLHFVGATASRSFGPLLCFVAGTEFTSPHLTSSIMRERSSARGM